MVDRFRSPWGVLPFDCVRKRFYGFSGEGAAQKIMKRRGVLIALRVVVISIAALDLYCPAGICVYAPRENDVLVLSHIRQ